MLWAGDISEDMEYEVVCVQHRARLMLAARTLLGESRGCNRNPMGFTWEGHVNDMNERDFKLRYRVGSEAFYKLLDILEPELKIKSPSTATTRWLLFPNPQNYRAPAMPGSYTVHCGPYNCSMGAE